MKPVWTKIFVSLILFVSVVFLIALVNADTAQALNSDAGLTGIATDKSDTLQNDRGQLEPVSQVAEPTWAEVFLRGLQRKDFIGYTVALCLSVIALFLKYRKIRYVILFGSIVYLGFVTELRLSGLGGPSTLLLSIMGVHGSVKINTPWYMLWGFIVLIGLIAGRTFCGWMCPMGAIQQLIFQKKFEIKTGKRIHRVLRFSRFMILLALIVSVVLIPAGYWGNADPFRALYRFDWAVVPAVLLGIVLLSSLFIFTPWCKYVCPLGAVQALISKLSLFKVRITESKCSDCKRCARIDCKYLAITEGVKGVKPKINQLECTNCGECIAHCPEAAINLSLPTSAKKITEKSWLKYPVPALMSVFIIVILVGANVFQVPTAATETISQPTVPTTPTTTVAPTLETPTTVPTAPASSGNTSTSATAPAANSEPVATTETPVTSTEGQSPAAVPDSAVMTELGLELAFITTDIAADENITITVKTLPGATVFLQLVNPYTGTLSAWPKPADGGKIRVADEAGMATWSWTLYKMVGKGEGELHFLVTSNSDPDYVSQWKSNMSLRDISNFALRDDTIEVVIPWVVVKSNY